MSERKHSSVIHAEADMMRPFPSLLMVIVMMLPAAGYGDDYEDCKLNCAGERDTRNMDCPSPYDATADERRQCQIDSESEYVECLNDCPAPTASPAGE